MNTKTAQAIEGRHILENGIIIETAIYQNNSIISRIIVDGIKSDVKLFVEESDYYLWVSQLQKNEFTTRSWNSKTVYPLTTMSFVEWLKYIKAEVEKTKSPKTTNL